MTKSIILARRSASHLRNLLKLSFVAGGGMLGLFILFTVGLRPIVSQSRSGIDPLNQYAKMEFISETPPLDITLSFSYFLPLLTYHYIVPTWTFLGPSVEVRSFTVAGADTLYVGASDGVYRSQDSGRSWLWLSALSCVGPAMVVDPTTPAHVFAGTCFGPYESSGSGITWESRKGDVGLFAVSALALNPRDPQMLIAGTNQFEYQSGNVYVTENGGLNWTSVLPQRTNAKVILIDTDDSRILYVATADGKFLKTTNGGANWIEIQSDLGGRIAESMAIDSTNHEVLYTATNDGIFRSTNAGLNWTRLNTGTGNSCFTAITVQSITPTIVYAAAKSESCSIVSGTAVIYRSVDGGDAWSKIQNSADLSRVFRLHIPEGNPYFLHVGTRSGVWKYGPITVKH